MAQDYNLNNFLEGNLSREEFEGFWNDLGKLIVSGDSKTLPQKHIEAVNEILGLSQNEAIIFCFAWMNRDKTIDGNILEEKYGMTEYEVGEGQYNLERKQIFTLKDDILDVFPENVDNLYGLYAKYNAVGLDMGGFVSYLGDTVTRYGNTLAAIGEKVLRCCRRNSQLQIAQTFIRLSSEIKDEDAIGMFAIMVHMFASSGLAPCPISSESRKKAVQLLLQKGLVTIMTDPDDEDERQPGHILTSEVVYQLFNGYPELFHFGSLMSFCEYIKADAIREKQLFYDSSDSLTLLQKVFSPNSFSGISKRLKDKGHNTGITVLLHGPSGTGKTETVYQLSRNVHDIFYCDVSRLINKWVGTSEKAIRRMFIAYRYLQSMYRPDNIPVLLLNEGDALCGKRMEANSACDRLDNQIVNIFLEEMEKFDGFMVMTTNLPESIDEAFMRRFVFKIKLDRPSKATRKKIIKSLMPYLTQFQTNVIARNEGFAGGNIANISKKIDLYEAVNGVMPDTKVIDAYCQDECLGSIVGTSRKKVKGYLEYC